MTNDVALVGYSGHGFVVGEAAIKQGYPLIYYVDKKEVVHNPFALVCLGDETDDNFVGWEKKVDFILGIGDNFIRREVAVNLLNRDKRILEVNHPNSFISDYCLLGKGNFIANNAIVNANARVGNYSVLNTACIIEHDCQIGDYCHVAPGAVLAGNVSVGDYTFIGANAVVKQGVKIGEKVIIGAGAVVLHDIPDGKKAVGNPVRFI